MLLQSSKCLKPTCLENQYSKFWLSWDTDHWQKNVMDKWLFHLRGFCGIRKAKEHIRNIVLKITKISWIINGIKTLLHFKTSVNTRKTELTNWDAVTWLKLQEWKCSSEFLEFTFYLVFTILYIFYAISLC